MKSILVFVTTLDGKVTHWGDPNVRKWSSKEDQQYFDKIWEAASIVVIGSSTYDADRMKPTSNNHIIVMTSTPEKYEDQEVMGQLVFTDKSPAEITSFYEKLGHREMLVAGGAHVATSFLKAALIDELWLTIEPKIFGSGGNFVIDAALDIDLKLLQVEQINERGTLLAKYEIIK